MYNLKMCSETSYFLNLLKLHQMEADLPSLWHKFNALWIWNYKTKIRKACGNPSVALGITTGFNVNKVDPIWNSQDMCVSGHPMNLESLPI